MRQLTHSVLLVLTCFIGKKISMVCPPRWKKSTKPRRNYRNDQRKLGKHDEPSHGVRHAICAEAGAVFPKKTGVKFRMTFG